MTYFNNFLSCTLFTSIIINTTIINGQNIRSTPTIAPPPPKVIRSREVIVLTGNFSIDGQLVNIAEYDPIESTWSTEYMTDLYLYGEANGVVWDIAVNHTDTPYNTMFVVGAFDTVSETSQIQYCSVGQWDGVLFDKVYIHTRYSNIQIFTLNYTFYFIVCFYTILYYTCRSAKGSVPAGPIPLPQCSYKRSY